MSKKSRRLIRSAKPDPVVEPVAPVVAEPQPVREFYFLPDRPLEAVNERELHELMKDWRHGRATRTIGDAIQDAYVAIFTVLMIGAMATNLVMQAQATIANCSTATCLSARTLVPWAALAAAFGMALAFSRMFGPVLASAAEGFWLMDAPIRRSRLLGGRLVLAVLASGGVAALLGGVVAALAGSSWVSIGLWALATGLGCAGLTAFAAAEQGIERSVVVRGLQAVFVASAIAAMLMVIAIASGWASLGLADDLGAQVAAVVAGLGLVVMIGSLVLAFRRLDQIRRARLTSGGSLVSGMQGAMFALDFGLVRDILVERQAIDRGHVKPTRGRGLGLQALIWRDVQRLGRFPGPLVGLVVSVVVPYALDALGLSTIGPFVSALVLVASLVPFLSSLRVLTRTGGLARALPFKTSQVRTAAMTVPLSLGMLWALVTVPAFIGISSAGADRSVLDGVLVAIVTALAGWLGAVRWVTTKQVDFNTPMMATQAGALPPTLIFNLFRGFDIVAIVTAPVMLGAPAYWSLLLVGICFIFLRGTFSMDELSAEKEALERERAAASRKPNEKIKVSRPSR